MQRFSSLGGSSWYAFSFLSFYSTGTGPGTIFVIWPHWQWTHWQAKTLGLNLEPRFTRRGNSSSILNRSVSRAAAGKHQSALT
jgi:hypothetical protein